MTQYLSETNNLFLWIGDQPGREKITFGSGEKGIHYTLIFKGSKKVIDLHKTLELLNGEKQYEQIFEIKWFAFLRILVHLKKSLNDSYRTFCLSKRINIGKLGRHDLLLFPLEMDELRTSYILDTRRKKKLKLKKQIPIEPFLELFIHPKQLPSNPDGLYWVYSNKGGGLQQHGLLFQMKGDKRTRSFYFVTKRQLNAFVRSNQKVIFGVFKRLEII